MQGVLIELIKQLNGAVFTLIAVLLLMFWIVFKSGGWVKSYKDFQEKSKSFDDKIDSIKDNISSIKATTDLLYQAHLQTVKSHSPISLTQIGEETATAISSKSKVNDHWSEIRAEIKKKNPINPYDVQSVAMDIARNCFDEIFTLEEQNEIKQYAYEKGMNLLQIYPVVGIEIRNRYLKEINAKVEEIDKHDPTKKNTV